MEGWGWGERWEASSAMLIPSIKWERKMLGESKITESTEKLTRDRHTYKDRDRDTKTQTQRHTYKHTHTRVRAYKHTDGRREGVAGKQTNRNENEADIPTQTERSYWQARRERQTDRARERQTETRPLTELTF